MQEAEKAKLLCIAKGHWETSHTFPSPLCNKTWSSQHNLPLSHPGLFLLLFKKNCTLSLVDKEHFEELTAASDSKC
jgi:hypothetical protein